MKDNTTTTNGMTDAQREDIQRLAKEVALLIASIEYSPPFLFMPTAFDGKDVPPPKTAD